MDFFWEKDGWQTRDRHLSDLRTMPFTRPLPAIPEVNGLYILRGPRQVGKSSWLKTILAHYTEQHERCFFLSCEEVESYRELLEILRSVSDRRIILLDEVNFVSQWDRAVKHFVDSAPDRLLVVTGSHAYDLRTGADRMPGRFGGGGEFHLLPMDFAEFTDARRQAGWQQADRLNEIRAYFNIGGFPRAVLEAGASSATPLKASNVYWRWLAGDCARLGKNESYLVEVLAQIARTIQTPISFQSLAQKTSIGSHNTAQEYIAVLESCFAVRQLLAVHEDTGAARFRKGRKFYFTDPLLYHLALNLAGESIPADYESQLAEMVAHEHLARRLGRFGYFATARGEIDFYRAKHWAVEVKWSPVASNLSREYLNARVPQRIVWTQSNFLEEWPRSNSR